MSSTYPDLVRLDDLLNALPVEGDGVTVRWEQRDGGIRSAGDRDGRQFMLSRWISGAIRMLGIEGRLRGLREPSGHYRGPVATALRCSVMLGGAESDLAAVYCAFGGIRLVGPQIRPAAPSLWKGHFEREQVPALGGGGQTGITGGTPKGGRHGRGGCKLVGATIGRPNRLAENIDLRGGRGNRTTDARARMILAIGMIESKIAAGNAFHRVRHQRPHGRRHRGAD